MSAQTQLAEMTITVYAFQDTYFKITRHQKFAVKSFIYLYYKKLEISEHFTQNYRKMNYMNESHLLPILCTLHIYMLHKKKTYSVFSLYTS
jgi:hypothetical protein